jgi:hypothetical protein
MNNLVVVETKPARGTLTRITERFEATNPIAQNAGIIKNYIYIDQKRVIA